MTPASAKWVRTLFVVTTALWLLQLPLIYVMKAEPYPALTMPGFAGHPNQHGEIERQEPTTLVEFTDGTTQSVNFKSLLPPAAVDTGHIFREFRTTDFLNEPETIAWLRDRVQRLYPGRSLSGLNIVWQTAHYDLNQNADTPVAYTPGTAIHVEFGGTS